MDWFSRLTGFKESTYAETRAQFEVHGSTLYSKANGRNYEIGEFELASLDNLRARVAAGTGAEGRPCVQIVIGDVRKMHQAPEYAGALFQVASQFNALEMVGPSVTPEDGVTRYQDDHTQGPACAMAAGAATIFRNYFASVGDQIGQTEECQLDGLADIGAELSSRLGCPVSGLWGMHNGYALCTRPGLDLIADHLGSIGPDGRHVLTGELRIGVQGNMEVTDAPSTPLPVMSFLLSVAHSLRAQRAATALGRLRATGARWCLQGNAAGGDRQRPAWRVKHCAVDHAWRRSLRQRP